MPQNMLRCENLENGSIQDVVRVGLHGDLRVDADMRFRRNSYFRYDDVVAECCSIFE